MNQRKTFRFIIDAFSPDSIPMGRLAEYMSDLAKIFGNQEKVHFVCVESGSTVLVQEVEHEAIPKVRERLGDIKNRIAPEEALNSYLNIDRKLREDNATGVIMEPDFPEENIIEFPGRDRSKLIGFDPITQVGSLDGVLIRVGGKDATVPVYLQEGEIIHKCNANRDNAKKLAPYLFDKMLRVHGRGKWRRDDFGNWVMERFTIEGFILLDESSLGSVVTKLQSIPSEIHSLDEPIKELDRIRHGTRKDH